MQDATIGSLNLITRPSGMRYEKPETFAETFEQLLAQRVDHNHDGDTGRAFPEPSSY